MREGSLEAPTRHPLDWNNPDFYDMEKIDAELRRVFDICHGCRRCFNLCDSFPRLFDLVDAAPSEELDTVESKDFKPVVDACTLCDLCYMTKCPYVPPHEFNLDFPHLMLRYRAAERAQGKTDFIGDQLSQTDRNGALAGLVAPIANWATDRGNALTRPVLEKVADIHKDAELPKFHGKTLVSRAKSEAPAINKDAPGYAAKRRAAIYATCFGNYNNPDIGVAAQRILAHNGVDLRVDYPGCCGMPRLEQGDIADVAKKARVVAEFYSALIDDGYDIVALVPSCALMLKFEWPLILPDDPLIKKLAQATYDISEYIVDIAKKQGLAPGLKPLPGGVTLHLACHARAQNMGNKAVDMLKLIPEMKQGQDLAVIERCAGHGGSWGVRKEFFEVGMKVGKPVMRTAVKENKAHIASECPLAAIHIRQGMEKEGKDKEGFTLPAKAEHPVELFAKAYGLI
jgi:glycerol-3-phosphate dehydrogenase subunit C